MKATQQQQRVLVIRADAVAAMLTYPREPDSYVAYEPHVAAVVAAISQGYRWTRTDQIEGTSFAIFERIVDVPFRMPTEVLNHMESAADWLHQDIVNPLHAADQTKQLSP